MKVEMRTLIVFMMMLFILLTSTALAIQPLTLKKSIDLVPIPLIPACDSEGIRHGVPKDVTTLFRIKPPPPGRSEATLVFSSLT